MTKLKIYSLILTALNIYAKPLAGTNAINKIGNEKENLAEIFLFYASSILSSSMFSLHLSFSMRKTFSPFPKQHVILFNSCK